jgi:DNA repair exonuclease SbcCD ATPase subunit
MSLNIAQLRKRVGDRYADFEQVDDSILRFTKKAEGRAFAVCYLDIAEQLPGTLESLTRYQDRVIGKRYFEDGKSIQWNNYLYFVTSLDRLATNETRQAKELIERDRTYARKFVISEEELDSVLIQPVIEIADVGRRTNVTSLWMERLTEAGLDHAITVDENLPKRLALIEASKVALIKAVKQPKPKPGVKAPAFIRSLNLTTFRKFPLQRGFDFGTVNLIFGSNATGKTSLLEAIELFYCGKNKRNRDENPTFELDAVLADGRTEKADSDRPWQEYRNRNLDWYGVSEIKTSKLYASFSQFNFLDSDAAVSLTESTAHIEEDLARLLVGSDASKIWETMNRVREAVSAKLNDLRSPEKQMANEIADLQKRIKEAAGIKQESDSIRIRLGQMTDRVGWKSTHSNETIATILLETLTELIPVAQQASALSWTSSPVSIDGLAAYCREARITSEKSTTDLNRIEELQRNQKKIADAIKRDRTAVDLAQQAKRIVEAGVAERIAERTRNQTTIGTHSGVLAGLDADSLRALSATSPDITVAVCHQRATAARTAAEALLAKQKREYADFTKLRAKSLSLMQELRETAGRVLENTSTPDRCPLCHTQFEPGGLTAHMNMGVDEHVEAAGQKLLNQMRQQEKAVGDAVVVETVSAWLKGFCEAARLTAGVSVASAMIEVQRVTKTVTDAQARVKILDGELRSLEGQGFSVLKLDEILSQLRRAGFRIAESSREAWDGFLSKLATDLTKSIQSLEAENKAVDELQQSLQARFPSPETSINSLKSALSGLNERIATTSNIQAKLTGFAASFPWPGNKSIAELVVEAESIRKVAAELQVAVGRETQARTSHAASTKRKEDLDKQLKALRSQIKRLTEANSVLQDLIANHSLSEAMKSALQENRGSIETIFARIHSPAEFQGLGTELATLIRKENGEVSALSQISTGQRAAFALSIFLAQNAQLTSAPPVILIDDPIAHVDDLNSLSFLDYLRDVALTGRRQIFFATANDKLATLFERKFDFLGPEDFRRFDLRRDAQVVGA